MNIGGVIIVVSGVFLVIVGLRGTQGNVFPWFFKTNNGGVVPGSSGSAGGGSSGAK